MLHYIEGPHNILANNLSRLHCLVTLAQIAEGNKLVEPAEVFNKEEDKAYFLNQEFSGLYDDDILECIECYLNLPDTPHLDENLLNYAHTCKLQQQYEQLLALQVKYPDNYVNLQLDDIVNDIIYYKKDPTQPNMVSQIYIYPCCKSAILHFFAFWRQQPADLQKMIMQADLQNLWCQRLADLQK